MDAKYYCGTCQLQLIDKNENDDNYVNIVEHPQLLDFIAHNITTNQHKYHYDFNLIKNYLPYLCYSCLKKWQDFQNYCLMAIESYENLKKVLHCEKPHKPSTVGLFDYSKLLYSNFSSSRLAKVFKKVG